MQLIPIEYPTKLGTLKINIRYEGLDATNMRASAELEELPGALSRSLNIFPGVRVEELLKPQELRFSREKLRELGRLLIAAADTPITLEG